MLRKIFFLPALFVLCWVYAFNFRDTDFDLWARMAVGKIFFQTGGVVHNDIFSYTVTKPWIDHEWGSGVIFYFFSSKFGDMGLLLLKLTFFFTILFLISRIIKLHNPKPDAHKNILFYLLIIIAVFAGIGQTVRCQLFTFTLFTLWVYILERVRNGEDRLLWIMPATMVVWANLHGGFVAGIGLLLMYGVGEFLNKKPSLRYFLISIPTAFATLINPYGFKYLQYMFHALSMKRELITEWQKTDLLESFACWYAFKLILLVALVSIIFYFIKNKPKFHEIDKTKFIVLLVTLFLALKRIKLQAFFVISTACYCYHDFYAIFQAMGGYIKNRFNWGEKALDGADLVKNGLLYAFILGACSLLIIFNPRHILIPINKFPVSSVEFVRQNELKGNLVTIFHWGSYVAWKLYPNCLIALDGRYEEVYPDSTFYSVGNFISHASSEEKGIRWDEILDQYHTDIIILGKQSEPKQAAFDAMKEREGWKLVFEDIVSGVFVRTEDVRDDYIIPPLEKEELQQVMDEKYDTKINFL